MNTTIDAASVANGFRSAMRRMASSVCVITTSNGEIHQGMAASSVTSLSMQPPSLLVCINKSVAMHDAVHKAGLFCVNLLGEHHGPVCDAFGGKLSGPERFTVGEWAESAQGLRYLVDAPAAMICRLDAAHDYGTHTICIGAVEEVILAEHGAPLLYREGSVGKFVHLV
jgi:flavin reductase (DIM6/NTAB) family NADH-FMN oxidoreductase RutF